MSKPALKPDFAKLEADMMESFLAGHHEYRRDLKYPESHSDMQAGLRVLMRVFDIKRRPIPLDRSDIIAPAQQEDR